MKSGQQIVPCLWFDDRAEEAANFYLSIFPNSRIARINRYTEAGHEIHGRPAGSVMTVELELNGQRFTALNGGPVFTFNEAISLQVSCETQDEIDHYWTRLSEGGEEVHCGWLKDKFGVSWQVVPAALSELFDGMDPGRASRVMQAMLGMQKFDIAALERAAEG